MLEGIFYRFGSLTYRLRWVILFAWIILLIFCMPFVPNFMSPFKNTGFKDPYSESAQAETYINKNLKYNSNRFVILYKSDKWSTDDERFMDEMKSSLKKLKNFPYKNKIIYPDKNNKQNSADKHSAYAVVLFNNNVDVDTEFLKKFKSYIVKPENLTYKIGGEPIFLEETRIQTQTDLFKGEYIATPVAIITMLVIFGSVVSASIPVLLGVIFAILIFTSLFFLGNVFSLSIFTINIALLLGLCINLDYALFFISRFRYELRKKKTVEEAISVTQATAGKAVFYSGLTVLVSLSALLLFPINILFSVGVGGMIAVFVALAICNIFLPALLSILGRGTNALTIPFLDFKTTKQWHWIVHKVVNHAWIYFFLILSLLIILSFPFLKAQFGISDIRILPKTLESRQVFDVFQKKFSEGELAPISVVIKADKGNILARKNLDRVYDVVQKIKDDPYVSNVTGIVSKKSSLSKSEYYNLYHAPENVRPDEVKKLLELTTHNHFTVITVICKYGSNDDRTKELIEKIRNINPGKGLTIQVTGASANTLDVLNSIYKECIFALLWTMFITYLILLVLLRSVFLPLKAIMMNLLSLSASFGVLAFVVQLGYFNSLLNIEAQGMLDISLLIIIFCSLFGFSMDYEVFLLTRIKEEFEKTGDNLKSTICGIEFSGKIITSAALIVIMMCFSFMSADILIVKAFGLGIAVAIFVDAFLIRIMLVPATMILLGDWNWYFPKWLNRILPKNCYHCEIPDDENRDDYY
jgi:RND superfamily putative drug exporter